MFRKFEDIEVWRRGCGLVEKVYALTGKEPLDKDWGLRDQIRRSAVSVPANIAEGYERNSRMEFRRYLLIAKGSCGELRTHLNLVKLVYSPLITEADLLISECLEISSILQILFSRIKIK